MHGLYAYHNTVKAVYIHTVCIWVFIIIIAPQEYNLQHVFWKYFSSENRFSSTRIDAWIANCDANGHEKS